MSIECCPDHKPGMEAVNGPILLQSLRSGGKYQYNFKPFEYCPWCGKRQTALNEVEEKPKVVPLSPDKLPEAKKEVIPDFVLEVVNELIVEKFSGNRAEVTQSAIVSRIIKRNPKISKNEIFDKNWLDFEFIYREVGWEVEYEKPAFNESYPAFFVFRKK